MQYVKLNIGPFLSRGEGFFPKNFRVAKAPVYKLTYPKHKYTLTLSYKNYKLNKK